MSVDEVTKYLQSEIFTPFFLVVGDNNYVTIKDDLSAKGLEVIGISEYCTADRQPNLDDFFYNLKLGGNKIVVGLGEYLSLRGEQEIYDWLIKLQYYDLNGLKAILLLRGVKNTVMKLQSDLRFDSKHVCYSEDTSVNLSVTCISDSLNLPTACLGLKGILAYFESGQNNVIAKTANSFTDSSLAIHTISSAYYGIKYLVPSFSLPDYYGNDENWNELLILLITENGKLETVFNNYNLPDNVMDGFSTFIQGTAFVNWLYFIALKLRADDIGNLYLRYVLEKTHNLDILKYNVINEIINISHNDSRFDKFYAERRQLIEKFAESDIADFVVNNRANISESVYKLTDLKRTEREEFIVLFTLIDKQTMIKRTESTYPALYDYLYKYTFADPKLSADLKILLTEYFEDYKRQKIINKIDDTFVAKVEELANDRQYPFLPSRADIMNGIDKTDTFLYWLDALGVEFLSFIQKSCKRLGLSIIVHIGRADLPTITIKNDEFYYNWEESRRESDKNLDEIKHKPKGGYNYQNNKLPIHLVRELEVISEALNKIATLLALRHYKKVLLVSDHGSSRLAVIKEQEEKYETATQGQHSGRCCEFFTPYDLPFATEENGYLVLANYGRFKGSRAANVEVHGGAALEEVVVPIIEISLANPNVTVKFIKEVVYADYKTNAELELYSNSKLNNASVIIKGKSYIAVKLNDNRYNIMTDIKRAGDYQADVFDGDNLIERLTFTTQGGSGKKNADFDDIF